MNKLINAIFVFIMISNFFVVQGMSRLSTKAKCLASAVVGGAVVEGSHRLYDKECAINENKNLNKNGYFDVDAKLKLIFKPNSLDLDFQMAGKNIVKATADFPAGIPIMSDDVHLAESDIDLKIGICSFSRATVRGDINTQYFPNLRSSIDLSTIDI